MPANSSRSKTRRILVLGGYAALFSGFTLIGGILFLSDRSTTQARIDSAQRQIADRLAAQRDLDQVNAGVDTMTQRTSYYQQLVPSDQDLGKFLTQLTSELDRAGMRDIVVRALPPVTLGKTQKLPIEVRGKGSFQEFRNFLTQLENLPRKSAVGRLSIDADGDISGAVDTQVTLFIYNTKPPGP